MLLDEIIRRIHAHPQKRIPFSEYMGLALYHPQWGYYNQHRQKIGREGDFYTSSSVGRVFGVIWANHFIHAWEQMGLLGQSTSPLIILEVGGGTGDFANAVLDELKLNHSEYYKRIYYYMHEQSEYHMLLQKEKVINHLDHIEWFTRLSEIKSAEKGLPTLIFSNELFDALPVDRVKKENDGFAECWLEEKDGRLKECWIPLERAELFQYITEHNIKLPNGFTFEISLAAKELFADLAQVIDSGYIFTVDYGWLTDELLRPERKDGTLMGYYKHQHKSDYYKHPGKMDLTTHVHFDDLIIWGKEYGLEFVSYTTQREWLLQENILEQLQGHQDPNPFSDIAKKNRAIIQLISPGGMGDTFKVLTQKR